ncbi:DUF3617 family protein [Bradyrhizobium sp. dw_78]|uniref:DUF3617 domain-containing protein n=1 Tax=Bradyrhizobium sp. dw_78 TaxID=2719793 RepID=UPI001BD4541E|nr:DUF3617 family protein [Bradyrhizobium sp. dw_78]
MTQRLISLCLTPCLLASCLLLPAFGARADELPLRKAGLWEMKMARANSSSPETTIQQCTDEASDRELFTTFSPMSKEVCSRKDIQKTATGYVSDSVCGAAGVSITSHAEITGDFSSAYTVKSTSNAQGGPAAMQGDHAMTIEAKWLGACKPDQKPGDIVMPGGLKMNIHDLDKLKSLLPKSMQK